MKLWNKNKLIKIWLSISNLSYKLTSILILVWIYYLIRRISLKLLNWNLNLNSVLHLIRNINLNRRLIRVGILDYLLSISMLYFFCRIILIKVWIWRIRLLIEWIYWFILINLVLIHVKTLRIITRIIHLKLGLLSWMHLGI